MATTIVKRGSKISLKIQGARVFDPALGLDVVADVHIEKGQIAAIYPCGKTKESHAGEKSGKAPGRTAKSAASEKAAPGSADVIEAHGSLLLPGFVDPHAHLRTPGREDEEDISSGTRAAAAGGYVTICAMPNTDPVVDNAAVLASLMEAAENDALVRVAFLGAVTRKQEGLHLADLWDMAEVGAVAFSDDGRPVYSAGILRAAFQAARFTGLPLSLHCEDTTLAGAGVMNEGEVSARLGLTGIPCAAESSMVARDLEIAMYEGARVHFAHISCRRTLEQIKAARMAAAAKKAESGPGPAGFNVTCEVSPHHLTLTDDQVESLDTNFKMNPPLRGESDRLALIKGLAAGDIDCIGTDHAPHAAQEKETSFEEASFGVIGLETAFPILYTELVETGLVSLEKLVLAMSHNPAKVFGLPAPSLAAGSEANLTLVDTSQNYDIDPGRFNSKSRNTAFAGRRVKGRVLLTLAGGKAAYKEKGL